MSNDLHEPSGASIAAVREKLKLYHDVPVNTQDTTDKDLNPLISRLMDTERNASDGKHHWFCHRADSLTRDLATFLLRLFAYASARNDKVEKWKERMLNVWKDCPDCIQSMDEAKVTSSTTYFGAFHERTRAKFWSVFEAFEVEVIVQALDGKQSTADISPTVLYHMLSKVTAFKEPAVLKIISAKPFAPASNGWPLSPPPPGILLLAVHEDDEIRDWAIDQMKEADRNSQKMLNEHHKTVLQVINAKLESSNTEELSSSASLPGQRPGDLTLAQEISSIFPFSPSIYCVWTGLAYFLPTMSYQDISSLGLHRLVIRHLHDNDSHFRVVLRSFLRIMMKGGKAVWADESADFPLVVFDSIKDNPNYIAMVHGSDPRSSKEESAWFLFLLQEYLKSTWNSTIFGDLVARTVAFFCDELQHERFQDRRPFITEIGMKMILNCVAKAKKLKSRTQYQSFLTAIDIHAELIIAVAASPEYDDPLWTDARQASLSLIEAILITDIKNLADSMITISMLPPDVKVEQVKNFSSVVLSQLWSKFYSGMTSKNANAVSVLMRLAGTSAKLDTLSEKPPIRRIVKHHDDRSKKPPPPELMDAVKIAVNEANKCLAVIHNGFSDCIMRFADDYTDLQSLLQQDEEAKHVVYMLLSPVESYRIAAETLISRAYDVDMRADYFRELLKAAPRTSLEGFISYLTEFCNYAESVSEACSTAKALVRTMTYVIEVLGNAPDGLLRDPSFVAKNSAGESSIQKTLPVLWKAMATSMAVIFKRTTKWAAYYDNKEMVEWMRDALIFGRDLLEQRHSFELAILPPKQQNDPSPRKSSSIGQAMIEDLQGVLLEVQAWLRLTDMELLHQSFALLKSLFQCFHESGVKPSQDALNKLNKFIDTHRTLTKKGTTGISGQHAKGVTFLNPASLTELEVAISEFDDDEVQIISDDEVQLISVKRKIRTSSPEIEEVVPPKKRKTEQSTAEKTVKAFKASKQSKLNFSPPTSLRSSATSRKEQKVLPKPPTIKRDGPRGPKFEGSNAPRAARAPSPDSSSSSDSSDSDDLRTRPSTAARGLASVYEDLKRKEEFLKKAKPPERRQIKVIEDPMINTENSVLRRQRKHEEARRAAARMKPDISRLHSIILTWNYDYDGDKPPYIEEKLQVGQVRDQYSTYGEYQRVFEPLLVLECWAQIVQSKQQALEAHEYNIVNRSFVDKWLDLDGTSDLKQDWRLTPDTDIVLLRHATERKSIMAKVTVYKKTPDTVQIGLRCSTAAFLTDPGLTIGSVWRLSSVFSLSTLHREYAALIGLAYYDLLESILKANLSPPVIPSRAEINQTMQAYQLNEPQAKAIISSLRTNGFSLIQGPPGTGKTSTICGLVGAYLSTRKSPSTPIVPGRAAQKAPVPKILICAPSNAAVDEVAKRLIEGVRGSSGQRITPKVVRVGADASINVSVKEVSIDYLVEHRLILAGHNDRGGTDGEMASLLTEMARVKRERLDKTEELKNTSNNASRILALEDEIKKLNSSRIALSRRFNRLKDAQKSENRSLDATRRQYRYEILSEADIICSTLSGSGHEQLEPFEFPLLIIDEAAQCVELSSLIPLKYQSAQCIMVGDPQQLPPTVLSQEAAKWGYDQSLFVRLQKQWPKAVHLLSIQYRMHPEISRVPSKVFYNGRLHDGPGMAEKTAQPWHAEPKLGVYKFFSAVSGREEQSAIGHSNFNREECNIISALYFRLTRQYSNINFDYRIGIVSMYKEQVRELRKTFMRQFGQDIINKIDFNTVDGFQGQEKDIIILSCVRAGPSLKSIGFLSDVRRMNVAITRSRCSLYIIGHAPSLERNNETWRNIIDDARSRACLVELPGRVYFTQRGDQGTFVKPSTNITTPAPPHPIPSLPPKPFDLALFSPKDAKASRKQKQSIVERTPPNASSSSLLVASDKASNKPSLGAQQNGSLVPTDRQKCAYEGPDGRENPPKERIAAQAQLTSIAVRPEQQAESSADAQRKAEKDLERLRQRKKAKNVFIKK